MQSKQCPCRAHIGDRNVPTSQFYRHASRPDGLSHSCKICVKRQTRDSRLRNIDAARAVGRRNYQNHKQKYLSRTKATYATNKGTKLWISQQLINNAKTRAKAKSLEFNITRDDVIVPERCPILGIPLVRSDHAATDNSPTIDRIDPTRGYTKDNIHVISKRANVIKSYGTPEEHKRIYEYFSTLANETN